MHTPTQPGLRPAGLRCGERFNARLSFGHLPRFPSLSLRPRVSHPKARMHVRPEEVPEREEVFNICRIEGRPGADPVESEYA